MGDRMPIRASLIRLLAAFLLVSGAVPAVNAAFEDMEAGPRATALGGAFFVQADDINALYYNPAGIAGLKRGEVTASHETLYRGLSDGSALSRSLFAVGGPITFKGRRLGAAGFGWNSFTLSGLYSENMISLNYAYPVREKFWAGMTLNSLSVGYGSDEYTAVNPVFSNGSGASSLGIDLGIIRRWETIDAGISLQNVNQPDLGIKYENKVARRINLGFSVRQEESTWSGALVLVDKDIRAKTGIERLLLKKLLNSKVLGRAGFTIGSRDYRSLSLGLGYRDTAYRIDYSFLYPLSGISQTYGSHLIGLGYAWGKLPEEVQAPEPEKPPEAEPEKIAEEKTDPSVPSIDTETRKRAQELVDGAWEQVRGGSYATARDMLTEADQLLVTNKDIKEMLDHLNPVIDVVPAVHGTDRRGMILRKAVLKYMNDDADAVTMAAYAKQLWPKDPAVSGVREVIVKEFPQAASTQKFLPGISVVDQMLQDALDLIRGGRFVQAVGTLNKVLEMDPNNISALTRMGSAYWAMGKKDIARDTWKKVLKLDPQNTEVREFLEGY